VARLWGVDSGHGRPTNCTILAGSAAELRSVLPAGLIRLPRQPADDPNIIEVWV